MNDRLSSLPNRVFETFFSRDLAYIFGGSLTIFIIKYAFTGDLNVFESSINELSTSLFKIIIFLVISYFIGFIIQETISYSSTKSSNRCNLFGRKLFDITIKVPESERHYFMLMSKIEKVFGDRATREIERVTYFKHIGHAIGANSFVCTIACLISLFKYHEPENIVIAAFFLLVTIALRTENFWKKKQLEELLELFSNELENKNSSKNKT